MFPLVKELQKTLELANTSLSGRSLQNYRRILARLLQDYQHPMLRRLSQAFRSNDYDAMLDEADFLSKQQYGEAKDHFLANQFATIIKKYPFPPGTVSHDPEAKAKALFHKSERKCQLVNRKFELYETLRCPIESELATARSFISYVLGDVNLDMVLDGCDFGPGASLGLKSQATDPLTKVNGEWTVGPGVLQYAFAAIARDYHLYHGMFSEAKGDIHCYAAHGDAFTTFSEKVRIVKHNKISFVPKTAKVHRTIAVEPLFSGYFQKGIDVLMRRKLYRIGIDLSDQSRNQEWARIGSLSDDEDSFVTIDLKSASDSISFGVVRNLLPPDWFDLLNQSRSQYYSLDGRIMRYEKFCSMGNGFCFPLETLLFCAIARASGCGVIGTDFSVYGDDIIIRKAHAHKFISLIRKCGFALNVDKTFLEGPFRESCGADWFGGKDVRPFTLDFALDSVESVFKFLNLTCRNSSTAEFFRSVRPLVWSMLPKSLRFVRPFAGPDNDCVTSMYDEHLTNNNCVYKRGRWSWLTLSIKPRINFDVYSRSVSIHLERVMLRGAPSSSNKRLIGLPEVTLRLTSQTKIARESYSSTSNWLPTPGIRW